MSWTEGQESCIRGRREKLKPGTLEIDESGETKAEAEGEETGAGTGAGEECGEECGEGLERASATKFSGSGM